MEFVSGLPLAMRVQQIWHCAGSTLEVYRQGWSPQDNCGMEPCGESLGNISTCPDVHLVHVVHVVHVQLVQPCSALFSLVQPCSVPSSQFPGVSRQSVKLSCRHEHPCFPIVFHITHHICCLVCNFIMSWQPFWIEAPDLFGQRLFGDRLRCELRPQRIGGLSVANRHDQNREQLMCFHRFKTHLDDLR